MFIKLEEYSIPIKDLKHVEYLYYYLFYLQTTMSYV